jgi:hypothetical protein
MKNARRQRSDIETLTTSLITVAGVHPVSS